MTNRQRSLTWAAIVLCILTAPAWAWHGKGHDLATRAALVAAGEQIPAFLLAGADTVANCSLDADAFTRPIAPPQLHEAEAPEHFFDLELLGGAAVPPGRYAFVDLCAQKGLKPAKVGLLPYALTEWTQRLTVALAEHRKWPDDPAIRQKCLVYTGLLAHYAADLNQPLHVTIHWDGRAKPDGSSPRSGIHAKIDALPGKANLTPKQVAEGLKVEAFPDLFPAVLSAIDASRSQVDAAYKLEPRLPVMEDDKPMERDVSNFTADRMRAAAKLIASLYATAWHDSEKIVLPPWHRQ